MKLQAFYTADLGTWLNRAILHVTGGEWAHMGILLTLGEKEWTRFKKQYCPEFATAAQKGKDGGREYRFYFESILAQDSHTMKTGVRGPYPLARLARWQAEDPKNRKLEIQDVKGLSQGEIARAIELLARATLEISYARMQLLLNLKQIFTGFAPRFRRRTRTRWTCCETFVRVLPAWYQVKYLEIGEYLFDEYAPSGTRLPGVYERVNAANRSFGNA